MKQRSAFSRFNFLISLAKKKGPNKFIYLQQQNFVRKSSWKYKI